MPDVPLIAVCGPIGAGKSTAVGGLARALGYHAWLERVDDNPFFERYCADPGTWALRSQLAFMLGAVEDAAAARRRPPGAVLERPVQEMFSVFVRDMHRRSVLSTDEVQTLERIVQLGETVAGAPDVLVALQGDPELMLERVRTRARRGEEAYDLDLFRSQDAAYARWVDGWDSSPVVRIDVQARDLRRSEAIDELAVEVQDALSSLVPEAH